MGIVLLAVGVTFCIGLTNIIPQAYGAKKYELCGAYLNRMIILSSAIFIPWLIPLQWIENLFLKMGLHEHVSCMAA